MTDKIDDKVETRPEQDLKENKDEFKIAEIWFRKGRIMLDAPPVFFYDKLRAYGVLEMCRQIVEQAKYEEEKPNIIQTSMSGLRSFLRKKKH